MPTYVYECYSCGKVFEKIHAMSEEPKISCPDCGKRAKRKITTGTGFIIKGNDSEGSCCGKNNPCEVPKRCCEH